MASLEKKIIDTILDKIRSRRDEPVGPGDQRSPSTGSIARTKLREATFSDFQSVHDLKRRWGLIPDSFENWQRLWRDNPALKHFKHSLPIGWVLEADDRVVGFLGNVASIYRFGDRTLTAVTGHALVVEPDHRTLSFTLNGAFYRQKTVDLHLSTTSIEVVGKIARIFKSDPLPQPDYDILFWVLQAQPFAKGVMEKLQLRPALSTFVGLFASLAVGTDKILRRRSPKHRSSSLEITEIGVAQIGQDFQALWTQKLAEGVKLFADRSPDTLRWHFETPGDRGTTRVLCCYRSRELLGYVVVRSDPADSPGLRRAIVADMIALRDDPDVLAALCVAAYDHAKHSGSHILEVLGFPQTIRNVCFQWNPYLRRYPSCPFYYRAVDPRLHQQLADASAWYASPFDGDTTLMPLLGE
jgi:hypothetical protein